MVMGSSWNRFMFATVAAFLATQLHPSTASYRIGVNYGRNGDDLPSPAQVVGLYQKCGIQFLRLYDPSHDALEALRGSNLQVSIGVRNQDIPTLTSLDSAIQWVKGNIAPYKDLKIEWITVGNEVIPGEEARFVTDAMENIHNALNSIGLTETKVTTSISMAGIVNAYPPSNGVFSSQVVDVMRNVAGFLAQTGAPLMVNVYPYFAYSSDPEHISFEYATFQATEPIIDGNLKYYSLFDAMVDSVNAAMEKIEAGSVPLVISETGWPTAGNEPFTGKDKAQVYNQKLLDHVQKGGTPRKPGQVLDVFIFAMFNEDQKLGTVEKNWGIFYPNMSPVYNLLNC